MSDEKYKIQSYGVKVRVSKEAIEWLYEKEKRSKIRELVSDIKADPIRMAQLQFTAFLGVISLILFYKIQVYSMAQAFIHTIMIAAMLGAIRGRR